MQESCTSGSARGLGEQSPSSTQPIKAPIGIAPAVCLDGFIDSGFLVFRR